ncbi:uncharacterized protein PHALS_07635 [Plasmopara halstedii]|uniref:Uncharacterized protein n=1 Tax=Plasmopara halstedii TaxID=4781 RepID=A0A0P1B522_PLAHL|nr:uncharacterized protein PHALS_07635 [Plasmopara halstedii]CEG49898.1 hypothetical protein PHALS_07635 [Plasmopara halstedii]|eukprot:XP_024586267.1 hypothetical protein PHALS_07635 [Plasmopara halstedii]
MYTLQEAVKEEYKDSHLAGITVSDLKGFIAKSLAMDLRASLTEIDISVTLIVQAPKRADAFEKSILFFKLSRNDMRVIWMLLAKEGGGAMLAARCRFSKVACDSVAFVSSKQ